MFYMFLFQDLLFSISEIKGSRDRQGFEKKCPASKKQLKGQGNQESPDKQTASPGVKEGEGKGVVETMQKGRIGRGRRTPEEGVCKPKIVVAKVPRSFLK